MNLDQSDESLFHSTQPMPPITDEEDHDPSFPYTELSSQDRLLPPPDFKPFFTLIEDPASGEHYHPNVHYVFSDDDADTLTSAALDAIEAVDASTPDIEERIVIIDMAPDGKGVAKVESLSPNWQAVKTVTRQAPSWGGDGTDTDRGMMLKISGEEVATDHGKPVRQAGSLEELVRTFGDRLHRLDHVLRATDNHDDEKIQHLGEKRD